jgi:hypothetical protein
VAKFNAGTGARIRTPFRARDFKSSLAPAIPRLALYWASDVVQPNPAKYGRLATNSATSVAGGV